MSFKLLFSERALKDIKHLENTPALSIPLKAVRKILGYLEVNPRHPSMKTHKYKTLKGPNDVHVFEAYAQNHTPGAYRIFWCYGPGSREITIIAIIPHP